MAHRLLIVDDEGHMLDFLERVFRSEYQVLRAQSVEEAEQALKSGPMDVVITDRRMPRRSGLELLQIVAERHPSTVRVLLTGYADSLLGDEPQRRLVDAWVSKPIDSAALREAVAEAISRRAG